MVIHEYGDSSLPKIVLLHPMMADAHCMLRLTESMEGKHYPSVHIQVREGYGHCMYLSEHYAEYGKLLERYMREEHKNV